MSHFTRVVKKNTFTIKKCIIYVSINIHVFHALPITRVYNYILMEIKNRKNPPFLPVANTWQPFLNIILVLNEIIPIIYITYLILKKVIIFYRSPSRSKLMV